MTEQKQKLAWERKTLGQIFLPAALLIGCNSLQALLHVKDRLIFAQWQDAHPQLNFGDYVNANLVVFLSSIIFPLALCLYLFFTIRAYGITPLFKFIWGFLALASLLNKVLELQFNSAFYYLNLSLYLLILVAIARLKNYKEVQEHV